MLILAAALGATMLLLHALANRAKRVRIGGAAEPEQALSLERGQALLLLNDDLRPHQIYQVEGPELYLDDARLEPTGSGVRVHFDEAGEYKIATFAGPCLLPHLEHEIRREHAVLRVSVA